MSKVTVILCEVKPCTCQAEREFEVNGQTFYVCGQQCFARFWSREYDNWKESRYGVRIIFHPLTPAREDQAEEGSNRKNGPGMFSSDLQIVKARPG